MERAQIREFLRLMQDGNFAFLYKEYRIIAGKVGKGFGLIFKAQSIIACVNAILTAIGLSIIGFFVGNAHIEPL
jgi:predicted PurR-regulated permease PerM